MSSSRPAPVAFRTWPLSLLLLALLAGCSSSKQAPGPRQKQVTYQVVTTQPLALEQELPGRTVAYMVSDVRPQVSGIIQKRLFTEGQEVKAGQVLYQIDPRPFQAAYDNARADLAKAEAAVLSAKPKAERYQRLVAMDAASKQDADDALATLRADEAAVTAARAAVETARINLEYTRLSAPIAGRIGISAYTPGALVSANQSEALTQIQQLDPIYVDVAQTSAQLLALRKQIDSGALQAVDGKAQVKIRLEDGSTYAHAGTLEFVGTAVDTGTGTVTLRALVPNPDHLLLPGTYVKAVLPTARDPHAILVPQGVVTRNSKGEAVVKLVGDGDKVVERVIQTGQAVGDQWQVTAGLKPGDKLIIAGGSELRDGQQVKAVAQSSGGKTAAGDTAAAGKAG